MVLSVIVFADDADAAGLVKRAISTTGKWLHSELPVKTVFTNQTNTYDAGKKQVFQSDGTTAGMKIITSSDPSGVVQGDIWFNTNDLKWQGSSVTQTAERTANKGISNGYAGLNNLIIIPNLQLATNTNSSGDCLKGDRTWGSCSAGGGYTKINGLVGGTAKIVATNTTLSSTQATFKSITQVAGNTTVTNGTSTLTFNLGTNVVMTGGTIQNVTKGLIISGLSTKIFNATTGSTLTNTVDTILVHPPSVGRVKYTLTLPDATANSGKILNFIYTSKMGVPIKIVTSPSTQKIDTFNNFNMTFYREKVIIQSTGVGWIMLNSGVMPFSNSGDLLVEDEFVSSTVATGSVGTHGWTSSGTALTTQASVADHPGIIRLPPATTAKSVLSLGSQTFGTGSVMPDTGYYSLSAVLKTTTASSDIRVGLSQSPTFANNSAIHNAIFVYNSTRSTNWMCNTRDGSGFTAVISNIAVVNNAWTNLRIVHVNSTGTDFWVNDAIACTINANKPTGTIQPFVAGYGRGGTLTADLDYFRFWQPNAARDSR